MKKPPKVFRVARLVARVCVSVATVFIGLALPRRSGAERRRPVMPATHPSAACTSGMTALAGGHFTMGERHDAVTVHPFCLDLTEVTVDAYAACVASGKCSADFTRGDGCNSGMSGRGDHPMNCVDWTQSAAYCGAHGKRLPSEEEWEWAAGGGAEGRKYPWGGADPDSQACWSGITRRDGTCAVGTNPSGDTAAGIHDMAGNVWEWTSTSPDANTRVDRGGSWSNDDATDLRAAFRDWFPPSSRFTFLGFRCAR